MSWFKRKKEVKIDDVIAPVTEQTRQAQIEIVANKEAKNEVIAQAKEANDHLQKLLVANHFTVTIFIAAGGKQQKVRSAKS